MAIDYSDNNTLEWLTRNPASTMLKVLKDITARMDGEFEYNDPSTPFMLLLETAALTQSDMTITHHQHLQKVYAKMAQTKEDLYHTMTDEDLVGAFAYPSHGRMQIAIPIMDVMSRAKLMDNTNIHHFFLPEGTVFSAGEFSFILPRKIDIRFMPKGGLQVIYGDSTLNEIFNFESNLIDYDVKRVPINGQLTDFLCIYMTLYQMNITSSNEVASATSGYDKIIHVKDQYFMCRVYSKNSLGNWESLNVTHSKINYDVDKPTATVVVLDGAVRIQIPQIYFTKGLISSSILAEVFTTKGKIDINLYEFGDGNTINIGLPTGTYHTSTQTIPIAMLKSLTSSLIYGESTATGGANQPSFDMLKDRHIQHALTRKRPVSDVEIRNRLIDYGFDVSLSEETVTRRLFLGSREMPDSTFGKSTAFATTTMATLYTTLDALKTNDRVINNGRRLTILPSALYSLNGKNVQLLDSTLADKIEIMGADEITQQVKETDYACTPFYHILDSTGTTFEYRVYQLDSPTIPKRSFNDINTTTEVTFGTSSINIEFKEPYYVITIFAKSSGEFDTSLVDKIFTQLTYRTPDKSYVGAINGKYIGVTKEDEYIWQFTIKTALDIDSNHLMHVKDIEVKNNKIIDTQMLLKQDFNLIYGISDYSVDGLQKTEMDKLIVGYTGEYVAMVHETLTVVFGKYLDGLYTRSRSIKGNNIYKQYEKNIYAFYEETQYEIDTVTGLPKFEEINGKMQYKVLHKKGDPILDSAGNHIIKHEAGTVMTDEYGDPIMIENGKVERTIDLFLINAIYRFATHSNDRNYYESLGNVVVSYLENYIDPVSRDIDNGTKIKFYPKINLGDVLVRAGDDTQFSINSALPFTLRIALSEEKYNSLSYRDEVQLTVINILREQIKLRRIGLNNLAKVISNNLGDDIFGVAISSPYLSHDIPVYSLINDTEVFTLARTLEKLANGVTQVGYDVKIEWVKQLI